MSLSHCEMHSCLKVSLYSLKYSRVWLWALMRASFLHLSGSDSSYAQLPFSHPACGTPARTLDNCTQRNSVARTTACLEIPDSGHGRSKGLSSYIVIIVVIGKQEIRSSHHAGPKHESNSQSSLLEGKSHWWWD